MRKFLLTIIFISLASLGFNTDSFLSEVNKAYSEYSILEQTETEEYNLTVVIGKCNDSPAFGICFDNTNKDRFALRLFKGDKEYTIKTSEGSVNLVAIKLKDGMSLKVIDMRNNDYVLDSFSLVALENYEVIGSGEGTKLYSSHISLSAIPHFYLSVYVIIISLAGIFAFAVVLKYRSIARKELIHMIELELSDETEESENNDYILDVNPDMVYTSVKKEIELDEEESSTDVKELLNSLGFNTVYSSLSEEDKNKIMIELMMLKANGKISEDEYNSEVIEVWKK